MCVCLCVRQITSVIPELSHIQLVMKLVWASSCEQLQAADRQPTELRRLLQAAESSSESPPPAAASDQHDLDGRTTDGGEGRGVMCDYWMLN